MINNSKIICDLSCWCKICRNKKCKEYYKEKRTSESCGSDIEYILILQILADDGNNLNIKFLSKDDESKLIKMIVKKDK